MGGIISGKIVGAAQITGRVCASSISAGDYTITIDPIEGGYRLRVERGGEVQTMELLDGKPGADGQASYVHIKYSSVPNPASGDEMSDVPQDYIGIYTDNVSEDSGDPADYTWARIKGEPGLKGDPGEPGQDAPQEAVLYTPQTLTDDQQAQARENVGAASAERVEAVENALPGKLSEPAEGLAVGKYFRVAAIDENGHAVLEAVDAPKEGLAITPTGWPEWTADEQAAARERMGIPGDYELIASVELSEDTTDAISITEDINAEKFSLKSCIVRAETPAIEGNKSMWFSAMPALDTAFVDSIRFPANVITTMQNIITCEFNRDGVVIPLLVSIKGYVFPSSLPRYTVGYTVKRLLFSGAGSEALPAGVKIFVYGVRE